MNKSENALVELERPIDRVLNSQQFHVMMVWNCQEVEVSSMTLLFGQLTLMRNVAHQDQAARTGETCGHCEAGPYFRGSRKYLKLHMRLNVMIYNAACSPRSELFVAARTFPSPAQPHQIEELCDLCLCQFQQKGSPIHLQR